MKCHICDKTLSQDEIKLTPKFLKGGFAPCWTCQGVIDEVFEGGSEEEISRDLDDDEIPDDVLDEYFN